MVEITKGLPNASTKKLKKRTFSFESLIFTSLSTGTFFSWAIGPGQCISNSMIICLLTE